MAQVPEKVGFLGGDVRDDDERRSAHFLWSMTKDPSKYKWKSEKQAIYYLNLYKKSEGEGDMWSKEPPKGTEMVFWVELSIGSMGGVRFGKKSRRLARILYMNRNGLLRFDEVKFYYDDKGGTGSGVDSIIQGKPTGISSETSELSPEKIPQWKKDKETMKAQSQHVGQPKERMQKELTLLNTSGPFDSQVSFNRYSYASYYINIYKDDQNNMYVHFGDPIGVRTSDEEGLTSYDPLLKGQKALIKFTVKKHTERDGTKQTIITRPKIVKKLSENTMANHKKPIFERYSKKLNESKRSEQISRSLGYLLSIAGNAQALQAGIEAAEPMLNKKLVKRLSATLHVISKIKTGKTPNESPIGGEDSPIKGDEKKDDKKEVKESYLDLSDKNYTPEKAKLFLKKFIIKTTIKNFFTKRGKQKDNLPDYDDAVNALKTKFGMNDDEAMEIIFSLDENYTKTPLKEGRMGELADAIDNILANFNGSPEEAVEYVKQELVKDPIYGNIPDLEDIIEAYIDNKVTKARQDSI